MVYSHVRSVLIIGKLRVGQAAGAGRRQEKAQVTRGGEGAILILFTY